MKNILFVDDDHGVLRGVQRLLERKGYTVHTISNPTLVADFMQANELNLVILDVDMPGKSGLEVFDELKKTHTEFPVLFATAHPRQFDVVTTEKLERWKTGFSDGLTDILAKPFKAKDFYEKVEALIGPAVEKG